MFLQKKNLFRLFLLCALPALCSCGPIEDEADGPGDRGRGVIDFDPDSVSDIDLDKIKKITREAAGFKNCSDYKSKHSISFSLLGPYSPAVAAQNCMAKVLDEGLAPLCEREKELKELAKKHRGNEDAIEDIEMMQDEIELTKEEISEVLYSMADAFDEAYEDVEDEIDTWDPEYESTWDMLMAGVVRTGASSELGGTVRWVERRARRICPGRLRFGKKSGDEEGSR